MKKNKWKSIKISFLFFSIQILFAFSRVIWVGGDGSFHFPQNYAFPSCNLFYIF